MFHSSELSPLTFNQATELGQTLNENVIKPTQEKVTLMFEVVDLVVGCSALDKEQLQM